MKTKGEANNSLDEKKEKHIPINQSINCFSSLPISLVSSEIYTIQYSDTHKKQMPKLKKKKRKL